MLVCWISTSGQPCRIRGAHRGKDRLPSRVVLVILVTMEETSLARAKAQLSALVSAAQHKRQRVIILRHGKPSAAIVPIDVALAVSRSRGPRAKGLTHKQVRRLFAALGKPTTRRSAVADLSTTRRSGRGGATLRRTITVHLSGDLRQ
jgi:prevent-host-death family protein